MRIRFELMIKALMKISKSKVYFYSKLTFIKESKIKRQLTIQPRHHSSISKIVKKNSCIMKSIKQNPNSLSMKELVDAHHISKKCSLTDQKSNESFDDYGKLTKGIYPI